MAGAASNEADKVWDVVIVGSGFAGALIAHELGKAKKEVLILEAGAPIPTNINDYMTRFYAAAAKVPESPYTPEIFDNDGLVDPATVNAGRPTVLTLGPKGAKFGDWTNAKQAYLVQTGPTPFTSTYDRIAGGTGHWLGTSLRFVPNDFKMKSAYGQFTDWPIGYDDLEHWYGEAEAELGVSADKADQEYLGIKISRNYPMQRIPPSLVDQYVNRSLNAKPLTEAETGFLGAGKLETIPVRSLPAARNSEPYRNRRACAGNTNCIPICPIQAKYDPTVSLNDAMATGFVKMMHRTVASDIVVGENGRVSHIKYIRYQHDRGPRSDAKPGAVNAKVFVIAANAIETARLLLMSRDKTGIANSNGVVGGDPNVTTVDFVNGMNRAGPNAGKQALFGDDLAKKLNDSFTRQFRCGFLVEQTPDPANRVTLSRTFSDGLGLPRPQISYSLSDYTRKGIVAAYQMKNLMFSKMGITAQDEFTRIADNDPTRFVEKVDGKDVVLNYMGAGHVMGTYRMGTGKGNSVVNDMQQSWDHANLYLVGSGTFPTGATANPTLTIAALALRTADKIVRDFKKG
jgi:glucose dehydrogenase